MHPLLCLASCCWCPMQYWCGIQGYLKCCSPVNFPYACDLRAMAQAFTAWIPWARARALKHAQAITIWSYLIKCPRWDLCWTQWQPSLSRATTDQTYAVQLTWSCTGMNLFWSSIVGLCQDQGRIQGGFQGFQKLVRFTLARIFNYQSYIYLTNGRATHSPHLWLELTSIYHKINQHSHSLSLPLTSSFKYPQ